MDPASLVPVVSSLVAAVVAYMKSEGAKKAQEKAAEVIGEKAGEAVAGVGPRALATLRTWFQRKADPKAQQALVLAEQDPDDADYQQKLVKETVRLAAADPAFAQELKVLADHVGIAQSGSVIIDNTAPNQGAQGVFNAPVTFNRKV